MRVGLIGRTHILIESAKELLEQGHQIAFIYTCQSEEYNKASIDDFYNLAKKVGCPFYRDKNPANHINEISKLNAEVCISINWLTLLKNNFLDIFPYGVLNAHAGDLPRYKGNACPNWAIINFEKEVGLTIHKMTEDLDSGPIILKKFFPLTEDTYITDVYMWIESNVPSMFSEALAIIKKNEFKAQSNVVKSLRTYPRKPEDSRIYWTNSTRNILANIRSSSHPFSGSYCFLNNSDLKLTIYRASKFDPPFDFSAVPGQVCMSNLGNPIIATVDGMIQIEECKIDSEKSEDCKNIILKSLRNRLT